MIDYSVLLVIWIPLLAVVSFIQLRHNASFTHTFGMLFLVTYVCTLIAVTLFPIPFQVKMQAIWRNSGVIYSNNLQPFSTIYATLARSSAEQSLIKIAGSFFYIMPLAVFLPALWKRYRSLRGTFIAIVAVSLSIEVMQLIISSMIGFTYKSANVDDLLFSMAGAIIGYYIYVAISSIRALTIANRLFLRFKKPV